MLMEAADAAVGVLVDHTLGGLELADHHLGQGGLTSSVGANEADTGLAIHTQVEALVQQGAVGVGEGHVGELDQRRGQLAAILEVEVDIAVRLHLVHEASTLHLIQHLHLGLSLSGTLLVGMLETTDVILHVRNLGLLTVVVLHLGSLQGDTSAHVGIVISLVVLELVLVHVDDVGADTVHEILGVGHHEEDLLELGEVVLEPDDGLDVEMVGGLVEEQQRGVLEERLGEGNTHTPSSGEGAGGAALLLISESKTEKNLGRAHLGGGGVEGLKTLVDLLHPVLGAVVAGNDLQLLLETVGLDLAEAH
eukprot:201950_1